MTGVLVVANGHPEGPPQHTNLVQMDSAVRIQDVEGERRRPLDAETDLFGIENVT